MAAIIQTIKCDECRHRFVCKYCGLPEKLYNNINEASKSTEFGEFTIKLECHNFMGNEGTLLRKGATHGEI